mgnify:CR=1 FL=1
MIGLLYKEYVTAFRSKRVNIAFILLLATAIFIVCRLLVPSDAMASSVDMMFLMCLMLYIVITASYAAVLTIKIGEDDRKNQQRNYMFAMPFSKRTYVASKYIFVGIVIITVILLQFACGKVYVANCNAGFVKEYAKLLNSFLIPLGGICLVIAAIDLPLILFYGKEKAIFVGTIILVAIVMCFMWFLFFGDLDKIGSFSIESLLLWVAKHKDTLSLLKKLIPIGAVVLYGLSYWIANRFVKE